jgi:ankyrin repeat protein
VIEKLLKSGADASKSDRSGQTPLHWAARGGHADAARLLLERRASVEARSRDGSTPLHLAAEVDSAAVVSLLLRHGADALAQSKSRRTPLHVAAERGSCSAVATLLDQAPKEALSALSAVDHRGDVPLLHATSRGHANVVRLLLTAGADPHCSSRRGEGALQQAVDKAQSEVAAALLEGGASVSVLRTCRASPLFDVAERGDASMLEVLLRHGADGTARDDRGYTVLHVAAEQNRHEVVSSLLRLGADANVRGDDARTPLFLAGARGHVAAVGALLNGGANPWAIDDSGQTSLHAAVAEGHREVAQTLIANSANVDATDTEGRSPLVLAAACGHRDAVKSLLECGASFPQEVERTPLLMSILVEVAAELRADEPTVMPGCRAAETQPAPPVGSSDDLCGNSSREESSTEAVRDENGVDQLEGEPSSATQQLELRNGEERCRSSSTVQTASCADGVTARSHKAGRLGRLRTFGSMADDVDSDPAEMLGDEDLEKRSLDDTRNPCPLSTKSQVLSEDEQEVAIECPELSAIRQKDAVRQEQAVLRTRENIQAPFFELMRNQGDGSIAVAWRRHFDGNGDGEVSFQEFCTGLATVGYREDALKLWQSLDPQCSNHLALRYLDPDHAKMIAEFGDWCTLSHGGPVEVFAAINVAGAMFLTCEELLAGLRKLGFFNVKDLQEYLNCEESFRRHMYPLLDPWAKGMVSEENFLFLESDGPKKRGLIRKFARANRYLAQGGSSRSSSANNLLSDLSKRSKWAAKNGHNVDIYLEPVPEKLSVPIMQHRDKQKARSRRHGPRSSSTPDLAGNPPPASADAANAAAQVMAEVSGRMQQSLSLPRLPSVGVRRPSNSGAGSRNSGSEETSCRSSIAASSVAANRQGMKRLYKRRLVDQLPTVNTSHHRDARFARGIAMPGIGSHQSQVDLAMNPQRCEEFLSQQCERKLFEHYYKYTA